MKVFLLKKEIHTIKLYHVLVFGRLWIYIYQWACCPWEGLWPLWKAFRELTLAVPMTICMENQLYFFGFCFAFSFCFVSLHSLACVCCRTGQYFNIQYRNNVLAAAIIVLHDF